MTSISIINKLITIILAPIWIPQAFYVKRVAIRLPEANRLIEKESQSAETSHLYVLGDSVAAGVGVDHINDSLGGQVWSSLGNKLDKKINWVINAKSGDKIEDLSGKVSAINISANSYFVVSIGVNDVTNFTSMNKWRRYLVNILDVVAEQNMYPESVQRPKVVMLAIPPMEKFPLIPFPLSFVFGSRAKALNAETKRITDLYEQVHFLPIVLSPEPSLFARDGFHPSAKGCTLLCEQVSNIFS
jgi:lysophospholipase L1-like esterase